MLKKTKNVYAYNAFLSLLFFASFALLIVGGILKGPFVSVDTHKFLESGNIIVEWLSAPTASMDELVSVRLFPQYAISSVVLSVIYTTMALQEWGVIVFNCALFALVVCAVFSVWRMIYPEIASGWLDKTGLIAVCGGIYIVFGLPDGFLWSYAILTDMLFMFWITVFIALCLVGFLREKKWAWYGALFIAVTAPFVRPPGILVPILYLFGLVLYMLPASPGMVRRVVVASVLVPAAVAFLVVPWLVVGYSNNDPYVEIIIPGMLERQFAQAVVFYKEGIVISNRFEMTQPPVMSYLHVVTSMAYRLLYYFVPLRFGEFPYSTIHNIVNGVYMLITLPLFMTGITRLLKYGRMLGIICVFLLMVSYSYGLLHAVTLVSFDWRYQLPAMVPYWLLTGCGLLGFLNYEAVTKKNE